MIRQALIVLFLYTFIIMSLIDKKKGNNTEVLIKIKLFIINIIISLAIYILIFTIGTITMFTFNLSHAKLLNPGCNSNTDTVPIPINIITDNKTINEYKTSTGSTEDNIKKIYQLIEPNINNDNKLGFCIDPKENKNLGVFTNSVKETVNFIYGMIDWYATFYQYYNISEIFILWGSPLFSFLFFGCIIIASILYLFYKIMLNSMINIFNNVFTFDFVTNTLFVKLTQIIISFWLIVLTICVFFLIPIPIFTSFTFGIILYSIFNILTQKFKKIRGSGSESENNDYGIFQKMADNLIYKKGYNILLLLVICIINLFLFDRSIGGITFAVILILYYIFYNNLHFNGSTPDSLNNFKYPQN